MFEVPESESPRSGSIDNAEREKLVVRVWTREISPRFYLLVPSGASSHWMKLDEIFSAQNANIFWKCLIHT